MPQQEIMPSEKLVMFSWLSRLSFFSWNGVIGGRADPAVPVDVVGHGLLGQQRPLPAARHGDLDLLAAFPSGR